MFVILDVRRFTPAKEVELCGHATLAAVHVLLSNNLVDASKEIIFETQCSGVLLATALDDNRIKLSFPSTPPVAHDYSPEELTWVKLAFGICDEDIVFRGKTIYDKFFQLTTEAFARITTVDYGLLGKFDCRGVIITAAGGKRDGSKFLPFDFVSRFFAPR
jgi:predicted PhzF superfamily epimerase YddE/YHI9